MSKPILNSFGAYSGRSGMTRAGATGSYDTNYLKGGTYGESSLASWTAAKAAQQGFGVFGYYTGTEGYGAKTGYTEKTDGTSGQSTLAANFMFNQKVEWDKNLPDAYVTKWKYAPIKYWPNEVAETANHDVDDQNNDTSNDPAQGGGTNGGKLTFFAYAPYVDFSTDEVTGIGYTSATDGSNQGTKGGIVAINGKGTLPEANAAQTDPIITYIVPSVGSKMVDLLWGTYGGGSQNVVGQDQPGVSYAPGADNYQKSILPHYTNAASVSPRTYDGYTLNADLTKQKTNGTVNFAFKHALAKVGGSEKSATGTAARHGLMVVLDLDDMMGAETGGYYTNTGFSTGDQTTLVTITDVQISANAKIAETSGATTAYKYLLKQQGDLNLATGRWKITTEGNMQVEAPTNALTTHNITSPASTVTPSSATLAVDIAEPSSKPTYTTNWSQEGVTTVAKNVYKNEANPLVFIPGTYPELTVTIDYTVRTYDENLATSASGEGSWTKVRQKVTKKVTFLNPVELNKQYNLLMHLGLTSVKFTATVSDWQIDGDDDNSGAIDGNEELAVTDVYLPINVGGKKYNFTSYSSDTGGTVYATGVAELTGNTMEKNSNNYYEVVILQNTVEEQVSKKYYIPATAQADGLTRYQLYDADGNSVNVWVTVSRFEPVTYYFTSYGSDAETTEYSKGTAQTTGNFSSDGSRAEIVVVNNFGNDTFVGKTFYIDAEAKADGKEKHRLYKADGTTPENLWVSISKLEPKIYTFTSYGSDSGTPVYSTGIAKTTGAFRTIGDESYSQILVVTNDADNKQAGDIYYVVSDAKTGDTKYQLYDSKGDPTSIYVSINEFESKTYNFKSYSAASGGTQYTEGTAQTTGNFAIFDGVSYQQIKVLTNPGNTDWKDKCFYIIKSAKVGTDMPRYQLRNADGTIVSSNDANVWIAVTGEVTGSGS